ncbi:MAG: FkbM family methyltransferase [Parcubacteria group bacterium]|nr:FkbM family methyltransferase [Parcubacteria group bacterium]
MKHLIKKIKKGKKIFNLIGLDIIKIAKSPKYSFLGLKNLPIKTIIDVGANKGQFAKRAADIFPDAHIYSFEPVPRAYKILDEWIKQAKEKRFTAYNLALGENEGTVEMFDHIGHSSSSSFLKTTKVSESMYPFTKKQESIPVKLTTLDNWSKNLHSQLPNDILIKLDVQGYEDRVIKGGSETFNMAKTCILEVCLDKLYENQATFKQLSDLLYNLGYRYAGNLEQSYAEDGHVIFIDAIFTK